MKCPTCDKKGLKSRVESVHIACMTLEVKHDNSFWDEDGNYHNHNHSHANYKCSNAHKFVITDHCAQCEECCK